MNDAKDPRFGAFMVYDNSEKKIYLNDGERKSNDTDEGAERLGMGIFLAKFCQKNPDPETLAALECYAKFLREKLQDESFKTWSSVSKTTRNRYFNYPWVARFYAEMYALTKDPKYLHWAYGTMKSMYAQFGHGKYLLDTPARLMIGQMRANPEFAEEEKSLMADFEKVAQIFMENGCAYPKQEVNFEQTIVCPAASHLMQMYFLTEDKKYLAAAEEHVRVLDAFAGRQPDWRLNGIAVRHWDGYWFGKSRMWGDVFPHYWAALNAPVYKMLAEASGDKSRARLAEAITRAALCNIFEDGSASCAYIYPDKVDGQPRRVWDVFANDQDWAAVFYLDVAGK